MNLASVRVITAEVDSLVAFYERVTGLAATRHTANFAEVKTPGATLAIGSLRTLQFFGGEQVASAASNRSAIIEFQVEDVDAAFARLGELPESALVQPPTTMPWGNRSLLLRDPDGNLVNLFTPLSAEARARSAR